LIYNSAAMPPGLRDLGEHDNLPDAEARAIVVCS
jgi:hypothetical protein